MWQRSAKNGNRWKYVCPLLLAGLLVLESVMPVPAAETGEATETAETAESQIPMSVYKRPYPVWILCTEQQRD